jgi:hypothetical protein
MQTRVSLDKAAKHFDFEKVSEKIVQEVISGTRSTHKQGYMDSKNGKKVHSTSHSTFTPPPPGPSRDFPITGNLEVIGKIDVLPNQPEAQPMGSIPQYQNDKQTATTTVANSILYRVQVSQSNPRKDISPYVSDQTLHHPFFRGLWPRLRPLRYTWLNPVP